MKKCITLDQSKKSKHAIKTTWKILNKVINKNKTSSRPPDIFKDDDASRITNINDIVNKFNNFFANVGPNLAKKIETSNNASISDCVGPANVFTMYLNPVSEEGIITVVVQCKNKTSEDVNNLSMNVIKNIMM